MAAANRLSTDDHLDSLTRRDGLIDALSRLTAEQREALLLTVWEGFSEKQAAAVLGCSRGALALRIHRARKQLRRHLAEEADHAAPADHAATVYSEAGAVHSSVHRSAKEAT